MPEQDKRSINPTIAAARSGVNLVFVAVPGANGEPSSTGVRVISTGRFISYSIPQRRTPAPAKI